VLSGRLAGLLVWLKIVYTTFLNPHGYMIFHLTLPYRRVSNKNNVIDLFMIATCFILVIGKMRLDANTLGEK
jgi:hypothetical protein